MARKNSPIFVTQPSLPPLEKFLPYLEEIWRTKNLTNNGPFHEKLEHSLCNYLGVKHISLFSNGTIALVTALKALRISGEVITTPYSFVATTHSLLWNALKPVFVDVDPVTLNIDPEKIEAAITPLTTCILAVHCYGYPCDVVRIQKIANKYGLKVIYDAAHAFGVQCDCGSILNHGDLSVLSFHATKVFNTFEGGAVVSQDIETKERLDRLKNFGFIDELTVIESGINGKLNEISSAFGLLQLNYIEEYVESRRLVDSLYRERLAGIKGIRLPPISNGISSNYSYFPIFIDKEYPLTRDQLYEKLKENNIFSRRYFYPLISDFQMYKNLPSAEASNLPKANKIKNEVLCLPMYSKLKTEQIEFISDLISQ